jgi:hypothetical protein
MVAEGDGEDVTEGTNDVVADTVVDVVTERDGDTDVVDVMVRLVLELGRKVSLLLKYITAGI